jgi:hypothetical protein
MVHGWTFETPNAIRNSIGMLMSSYLVLGLDFWGLNSFSSEMFLSRLEFEKALGIIHWPGGAWIDAFGEWGINV